MTTAIMTAASAMAAAVAAAAELVSQGGMTHFGSCVKVTCNEDKEQCSVTSDSEKADNDDSEGETEGDAVKRLSRSRERNREHARRTRLRKKVQLDALQQKVKMLEAEARILCQTIEECSIASILVGLSTNTSQQVVVDCLLDCSESKKAPAKFLSGKRKRFVSEDTVETVPQPLKLMIDGEATFIGGGKTHINWKSGIYCDDVGAHHQLTQDQLECLRYVASIHKSSSCEISLNFFPLCIRTAHMSPNNINSDASETECTPR